MRSYNFNSPSVGSRTAFGHGQLLVRDSVCSRTVLGHRQRWVTDSVRSRTALGHTQCRVTDSIKSRTALSYKQCWVTDSVGSRTVGCGDFRLFSPIFAVIADFPWVTHTRWCICFFWLSDDV